MWNNHHWKPTGNWQKGSCTTKAVRKTHRQPGKKGRRETGFGPMLLEGDSEEKGDCLGRHLASGVSGEICRLGAPVLGFCIQAPFIGSWRNTGTTGRLREAWTLLLRRACALASPRGRAETGLLWQPGFPQPAHPSQVSALAAPPVTAQHWIWGSHRQGEDSTDQQTGGRRGNQAGPEARRVLVAIAGTYSAHPLMHAESPHGPHSPALWLQGGGRGEVTVETGDSCRCEGQGGLTLESLSGVRDTIAAHRRQPGPLSGAAI